MVRVGSGRVISVSPSYHFDNYKLLVQVIYLHFLMKINYSFIYFQI